jgi:DNA adenine methylase
MKDFYSPLRYPGGKGKVVNSIKKIIDANNLKGLEYAEPFAGGASVALSLLLDGYSQNIYINDKDRAIYAFWYSIINHKDEFVDMISSIPINMDSWFAQKQIFERHDSNLFELGFATFFLNRTNRSGILKAGVIGGKNQSGKYSISERFHKENLTKRIELIHTVKDRIYLFNLDVIDFITEVSNVMKKNSVIYLDPPYYNKGKDLYMNHFQHIDHIVLKDYIETLDQYNWIVTYDNTPQINEIYQGIKKKFYNLNYSLINASKGQEVLFVKKNLVVPRDSFQKIVV